RASVRFCRATVLGRNDDRREPAERRQAAKPPLLGLFPIEALGVAGHERRDDGMLRLPGLQQGMSQFVAAPGAAGRLTQQLERALGRSWIGVGEANVGVDDADKGQMREVVAFGDELCANDKVVSPFRRRIQLTAQGLDPGRRIRRQYERAYVGKEGFSLLSQALDPWPAGGERVGFMALRAKSRSALDMAAMMANERGAKSVFDQPGRAIGAFEAMSASPAQREGRIAAPIEKQHRLLAPAPRLLDPGDPARRQPSAARRPFALEVDQGDIGQPRRTEARGKLEPTVASACGVEPGL